MPTYPYDNFSRDLDALMESGMLVRDDWMGNMMQVRAYMQRQYTDWHFPCQRFMLVMMYVSDHVHDFDTSDYAVYGSESAGALVGEHIFRAVHEIFTTGDLKSDPTPAEIMQLADKHRTVEG